MIATSQPADLFPGFAATTLPTPAGRLFARIGGSGPPLLLLHGYPQTHVCWHRIAGELARPRTVVALDLPGYGASEPPASDPGHVAYAKRTIAASLVQAMRGLGHERFAVAGHDRGARVAYRMALDHPAIVTRLAVLDILPTLEVWERMGANAAIAGYHWPFLAQPHPLPETLIAAAPAYYVEHTLASWTRSKTLDAFDPRALDHYRALLRTPGGIRAVCEDYRAGATIDRRLDAADKAAGRRIACPTLVIWGSDYVGKGSADPLDVWAEWCAGPLTGGEIESGHFLAEENPVRTLAMLEPFLTEG